MVESMWVVQFHDSKQIVRMTAIFQIAEPIEDVPKHIRQWMKTVHPEELSQSWTFSVEPLEMESRTIDFRTRVSTPTMPGVVEQRIVKFHVM